MSKYHPLDVRHPSNRENERRSYLLAPLDLTLPAATPARPAAESRREAARTSPARTARPDTRTETRTDARTGTGTGPWGKAAQPSAESAPLQSQTFQSAPSQSQTFRSQPNRNMPPAMPAAPERTGSGFGGFLRSLFFLAVILALLATQTNLLDPLLTEIRFRALEMGIRLPF
ncbi:MAG: hypothetical protein ACK4GT_19220 [Pararhodobacter sp.]